MLPELMRHQNWALICVIGVLLIPLVVLAQSGENMPTEIPRSPLSLGNSPRAMAFSPDGTLAYIINAGDDSIGVYAVDLDTGELLEIAGSPFPAGWTDGNHPIDLAVSADGTTLYVANSGFMADTSFSPVQVFDIDPTTSAISERVGTPISIPSDGDGLGGITISPDGHYLYVTNAGTNSVSIFELDSGTTGDSPFQAFTIAPYKIECVGTGPRLCLQITSPDGQVSAFYDVIEGFTYRWGYAYEVSVEVIPIENPPPDSSALRYVLVEVTKEERIPAGTTFDLTLSGGGLNGLPIAGFDLYGEQSFLCIPDLDCSGLQAVYGTPTLVDITIAVPDDLSQPWLITAWSLH